MPIRMRPIPYTALAALALAGCKVGPNYEAPRVEMPEGRVSPMSSAPVASTQPSVTTVERPDVARWWKTFDDPLLESLILRALESNIDLGLATSRVREARASR